MSAVIQGDSVRFIPYSPASPAVALTSPVPLTVAPAVAFDGGITSSAGTTSTFDGNIVVNGNTVFHGDVTLEKDPLLGIKVSELQDVEAAAPAQDDVLLYDTATTHWKTGNIPDSNRTGFDAWLALPAIPNYSIAGDDLTVRGGTGYIAGKRINWSSQTIAIADVKTTLFIAVDDTGTVTKTDYTLVDETFFHDNIVLFEIFYDGTNRVVCKENHPSSFPLNICRYLHNTAGIVVRGTGATVSITAPATNRFIGVTADILDDHGLDTPIVSHVSPQYAFFYLDAGGKWINYNTSNIFYSAYNNAGVVTALAANQRAIFFLGVTKDDSITNVAKMVAVFQNATYPSLAAANAAISAGTTLQLPTNELASLEIAQLGWAVINNNSGTPLIEQVIIQRSSFNTKLLGGMSSSHLALTDLAGGQYLDGGHSNLGVTKTAVIDPTALDSGFKVGTLWINTVAGTAFTCMDNTAGAAVWHKHVDDAWVSTTPTAGKIAQRDIGGALSSTTIVTNQVQPIAPATSMTLASAVEVTGLLTASAGIDGGVGELDLSSKTSVHVDIDSDATGADAKFIVSRDNGAATLLEVDETGVTATNGVHTDVIAERTAGAGITLTTTSGVIVNDGGYFYVGSKAAGNEMMLLSLENVALGQGAGNGWSGKPVYRSVAIGRNAMSSAFQPFDSYWNMAIGEAALKNFTGSAAGVSGNSNVAFGYSAMRGLSAGSFYAASENIAIGNGPMADAVSTHLLQSVHNIAIGTSALYAIDGGRNNIGIGASAGLALTTGALRNVLLGISAGSQLTTAALDNICIGETAGTKMTSGCSQNVIIGTGALGNASGTADHVNNVIIGFGAATNLAKGINCIAIGSQSGSAITSAHTNTICIGSPGADADADGCIRIGDKDIHAGGLYLGGVTVDPGSVTTQYLQRDSATGRIYYGTGLPSRRILKDQITPITDSSRILGLKPMNFVYKLRPNIPCAGLIVEDVLDVIPEMVHWEVIDGKKIPATLKYEYLTPLMLHFIQSLHERVVELEKSCAAQKAKIIETSPPPECAPAPVLRRTATLTPAQAKEVTASAPLPPFPPPFPQPSPHSTTAHVILDAPVPPPIQPGILPLLTLTSQQAKERVKGTLGDCTIHFRKPGQRASYTIGTKLDNMFYEQVITLGPGSAL